ncbi:hypothetical protein X737_36895 [Mesorhizobium sp. L48C026A00]|nr:hypothetical protein X737_36895 [Mesorhizobium sp. L48C026A00]
MQRRRLLPERALWMAPAMQEVIGRYGALGGCSLLSGLLMQPFETAGPDGSANWIPSAYQAMVPPIFDGLSLFPA